jgi:hypothetical protein
MQKKIIEISGEMVRQNIARACNISEYFALICDEELMYQLLSFTVKLDIGDIVHHHCLCFLFILYKSLNEKY